MSLDEHPELSVVVPVYNEERAVPGLFECLSTQRAVRLELIISDGGSCDDTVAASQRLSRHAPFPCRIVLGRKGRGAQLNRGAAVSRAPLLLFLHADSSFVDLLTLRRAVDALTRGEGQRGDDRVAGHFPLHFSFPGLPPLPYRYYEQKARLHRPGCTHGDQGFLLTRRFFEELGALDESLPLMEDTFLAERIRERGEWLLLPAPIFTSPRRFLREGLLPRQTLNAVLMNLAHLGRLDLIADLRGAYRSHDAAGRLDLAAYLLPLQRRIARLPLRQRLSFWYRTGSYVRPNAWQIAFFLDVLLQGNGDCGSGRGRFLEGYDRRLDRLTDHAAGKAAAAFLVWGWFQGVTLRLRLRGITPGSPARNS